MGKVQSAAWVTRQARLACSHASVERTDAATQVLLNDTARVLMGVRRRDKVRTKDLLDRTGIPTVNEIVVKQAALAAWKAEKRESPLGQFLCPCDTRTRCATDNIRRPANNSIAVRNMAAVWNESELLRTASTRGDAIRAARALARTFRHV